MKSRQNTIIFSVLSLTLIFCCFVFLYELHNAQRASAEIREHAAIVADDLWNFNSAGAREYLKPAAINGHYQKISIIAHSGEIFEEITTPLPSSLEKFGIHLHLVPKIKLISPIEYDNYFIGWIEAIWIPQTLSTHMLVLAFLVMTLLIILLYAQINEEKILLEQHVIERTSELTQSNINLKNEIRERTAAEEALQESERNYRHLTESIKDVIWVMSPDLTCTYMSPVCEKLFGWNPAHLQLGNLEKLFPSSSLLAFQQEVRQALNSGTRPDKLNAAESIEIEMLHRDAHRIWCEINFTCIQSPSAGTPQVMCVARDVSQRKAAQFENEVLQEKLERSKKMESLGLLAGGVAHDLNNVLSGIVSYPELILLDLPGNSPIRSRIKTIRDSGVKAAEIVQDLLALARRGVVTSVPVNMNKLIHEYNTSPEHKNILEYHPGLEIILELEEKLPDINGSEVHLKKVIMNLVSNAAEAIPENNNGKIHIATKSCHIQSPLHGYQTIPEGHYAVLSVSDNGEGISDNELKRIFEPFFTKKVMGRSGTGLGLTVVWGAVEDHNGYLDIESTIQEGTTIDLYFPITEGNKEEIVEDIRSAEYLGEGETVLIVDDAQHQREILTDILERLNYRVTAVTSGEEAVAALKDSDFDLVVLDMIMGTGMDGLETYREIHTIIPDQKVIIASGYAATDRVKEAQQLGAGSYLQKPYTLESISSAIQQALAS